MSKTAELSLETPKDLSMLKLETTLENYGATLMEESTFERSNMNVLKQSAKIKNENVLMLTDMFENIHTFEQEQQAPSDKILIMKPAVFSNVLLQIGMLKDEMCNVFSAQSLTDGSVLWSTFEWSIEQFN